MPKKGIKVTKKDAGEGECEVNEDMAMGRSRKIRVADPTCVK